MTYYIFSTLFFVSLFLSDFFQIKKNKFLIIAFSLAGYGGIVFTLVFLSVNFWTTPEHTVFFFIKILFLLLSVLLLVYLLFIEIPVSPQFKKSSERTAINYGSYGLVRHPAFYPFLFVTIALSILIGDKSFIGIAAYMNILNFILIVLEDIFLFPKIFSNYIVYKEQVPFLLPNLKSDSKKK